MLGFLSNSNGSTATSTSLRAAGNGVDYVSICSPNYLHDAHVRFAMRSGADAICEKPLVLNPWNLDGLAEFSRAIQPQREHNPSTAAAPCDPRTAQARRCRAQPHVRRRSHLHHVARPLVPRVLERRRGKIRRHRDQYWRPFLRCARTCLRQGALERPASAHRAAGGWLSRTRARASALVHVGLRRKICRRHAPPAKRPGARSPSTARRSSSRTVSPVCTPKAIGKFSQAMASASKMSGPRSKSSPPCGLHRWNGRAATGTHQCALK